VGGYYYAKAMKGEVESAHVYARINERYCAMQGWSSVNIRLDPYQAQVKEEPSGHQKIFQAIMRLKYGPQWQPGDPGDGTLALDSNGNRIAPPTVPENQSSSEQVATPSDRERDTDAT